MPRPRSFLLAAVVAASVALPATAPAAAPAPKAPTAIGVGAREFSLSLYRQTVKRGPVRFNVTNFGEDAHDLAIQAPGGRVTARMAEVDGLGGRGQLETKLTKPGTYTLICTLGGHARQGMKVKLRVTR